jgi:RNA-binding protein YhbY
MVPVEFQARVENGVIVVPDEYKQSLAEANTVKVTVLKQAQKQASRPDIMDELAQNPVSVPGIRSLTREEMHER